MKRIAPLLVLLACLPQAHAADIEAGRAKAAGVCAACHGATGISVAESIPNLAAQRAGYLAAQLRALKDGSRKNAMMNAIAAQLSAEDIANLAAYFAAQPGAQASSKSGLLPNMTATRVPFPVGFRDTFTRYHTMDFPATKQVRHFYANRLALEAARSGRPLPDGSVLLVEVHTARLDFDDKPRLFLDLSHNGCRDGFPDLHPAAGKAPEAVVRPALQQHMPLGIPDDRSDRRSKLLGFTHIRFRLHGCPCGVRG